MGEWRLTRRTYRFGTGCRHVVNVTVQLFGGRTPMEEPRHLLLTVPRQVKIAYVLLCRDLRLPPLSR